MIDPDFLAELDRFRGALPQADSRRRGERDSPAVGEGLTFSDYRRYSPGDEPGRVDWKLYARTEELYVKQYEEDREATVHVLLDASASMDYGEGTEHKFEYAAKLGLGVAYLTAREHDDFRFVTLDDGVDRLDDGRSTRGTVLRVLDRVNEREPTGEANFADALPAYADRIDSKSLVVFLSDCLADPDAIDAGLSAFADTDVVLGHVVAPGERDPPATGDTVVRALERDRSLRTYFGRRLRERYRDRFDAHREAVAGVANRLGDRYERLDTDTSFFDSFAQCWFV